ncbi:MBL fold metallo-hydrolase [Actinotalea sp. AC32]|nr:MBL fold metallo-hydrolase [Actinotalea sp. AC32]
MTPTAARELVEVAPGVLVATAHAYTTTSTVLVADDATCVLVDPAVTAADLDGLATSVAERDLTVVGGVSTHPHWDHVVWSRALGDVPRWATPAACEAARRERAHLVRDAGTEAPGHDLALLARLAPRRAGPLPWCREVLLVEHGAHAPGAAVVVVPAARALLAGDLLSDLEVPLLDLADADPVRTYLRALDRVEELVRDHDVRVVVPGHGHCADRAETVRRLAADRAYLDALTGWGDVDDERLADPWLRSEHERQLAAVRAR